MNHEILVALLTWMSLAIALTAAGLWFKAANVVVKAGDPKSKGSFSVEGVDVLSTASEQRRWNSYAAVATAIALVVQASSQAISS